MKKYLFFDVDGTLYNSEKKLPEKTRLAIKLAKENGHEVGIATGRAPFMIESLLEDLDIHTYVSFNGQYVVLNDEVIFTDGVENKMLEELISFGEKRGESVVFFDDQQMIASKSNDQRIEESLATLNYPYPQINANYYKTNAIYQTLIFTNEIGEIKYRNAFPTLQIVRWHPFPCDILPEHGSKARGIQKIMEHTNIPLNDIFVFGDGLNDVEMLSFVPNSVAMGNGHPKAKEVAKYITGHVDEDGLYDAMKMLNLI